MNHQQAKSAHDAAEQNVAAVWARQPVAADQWADHKDWNNWQAEKDSAEAERAAVQKQVWAAWRAAGRPDGWDDVA